MLLTMLPRSTLQSESRYPGRYTETVFWPAVPTATRKPAKKLRNTQLGCQLMTVRVAPLWVLWSDEVGVEVDHPAESGSLATPRRLKEHKSGRSRCSSIMSLGTSCRPTLIQAPKSSARAV